MKKINVTACLICMTFGGAYAQKGFNVGLEGGYNMTFIVHQESYGATELDYASTTGGAGGLVLGYNFDNHFGIQIDGAYDKQGQNYTRVKTNEPTMYRQVNLFYSHIPLMFKYSGGSQYPTRFYIMAGPQYSILNRAVINHTNDPNDYSLAAQDRFVSRTWDIVFELGAEVTLYKGWYANAGLRFNYGLNDINAPAYRMPNSNGIYNPSYNAFGGVVIGIHYVFGYNNKE